MKTLFYLLLAVVIVLATLLSPQRITEKNNVFIKKESYLIKVKDGVINDLHLINDINEVESKALRNLLKKLGVKHITNVFKNRYDQLGRLKTNLKTSLSELNEWYLIEIPVSDEPFNLIEELLDNPEIINVQLDIPIKLKPDVFPNDIFYNSQWHLNDESGFNYDINASQAWDINKGRNDVIIAILDGGVDYTHPDLDPGNRSRVITGTDTGDGDNDPFDDTNDNFNGHGTKVAGVVGAITNNGSLISGIMWNGKIMPVKMVSSSPLPKEPEFIGWRWDKWAYPKDVADAIDYAKNNGAKVINLSYGFQNLNWPLDEIITKIPILYEALDAAYKNNVLIIASMGNDYETNNDIRYPAGFTEQVVAVGAINRDGRRSNFSNTGSHINLVAPGSSIWTTEKGGGTSVSSGTSFSAPIVAGVSGLVISQLKDRGFNVYNDDIRNIIQTTTTDLLTPGFDHSTGHGLVDAEKALELVSEPNIVRHNTTYGGSYSKIRTLNPWIWHDGDYGLASGSYYDVDQYKVIRRINFDIPFCTPPKVWIRERLSTTLSAANPSFGNAWAKITNIDQNGYNVEYYTYYVRYDAAAREINKWVPAHPNSTKFDYTAIGEPMFSSPIENINGNYNICTSNKTFSINNLPS
jgi:subtilisin family serine protease